mgnify:CR=1 FL=1|jgi:hypothetical protein
MPRKDIFLFCVHPYPLAIYYSIAKIISANRKYRTCLIFVKHPYFEVLDYHKFLDIFDEIYYLEWVDYNKNIFQTFFKGRKYKKALKKINLDNLYLALTISYSDLPTVLFCKYVKSTNKNNRLIHLTVYGNFLDLTGSKFNPINTFFNWLNLIPLNGYLLLSYFDSLKVLKERIYLNDPHDNTYLIASESNLVKSDFIKIPFPLLQTSKVLNNEKWVIFFGDNTFIKYYKLNKENYYRTIKNFLMDLVEHYSRVPGNKVVVFYRPHPLDTPKINVEINSEGLTLFDQKITAEMIFSLYSEKIVATYSVSSTAGITSSHFGIPTYMLYKRVDFTDEVVNRFKTHFRSANTDVSLEVNNSTDIGSIDSAKQNIDIQSNNIQWQNFIGNFE